MPLPRDYLAAQQKTDGKCHPFPLCFYEPELFQAGEQPIKAELTPDII